MTKNIQKLFILLGFIAFGCNQNTEKQANNTKQTTNIDISTVPEWSKEVVWYQIFVERFRNGDPTNDPTRDDIKGTYPDSVPSNWAITPWTQDWYKPDAYFKSSILPDKWNNLQLRRYGGDLQGVLDKLDYLHELGITAIYFNPLNDSPSLHKYDPRTWTHIDVNFGPNPTKDKQTIANEDPIDPKTWQWTEADKLFLKVINECHKKGIKVILDYSFNHTGKEFWAFKDIQKNGKNSKVADWYQIESMDNPETPENEFKYKGWANVATMPEMAKIITSDPKEMPFEGNLKSEGAKQHIFSIARRWLDPNGDGNPNDGLDGYRLDVAAEVPTGFWREFRKVVRQVNPEAYLIGEIWWKSWPDELMFPKTFLEGDMFDAIMNYRWFRPTRHFFAEAPESMKVSDFVAELKDKLNQIDPNRSQAMMNLLASHDAERVSSSLYNKNKYKFQSKPYDNKNYKIDKPDEATRKILEMLIIHQFTYIGAPHIWNGDEVGMWGADDPDCRKPLIWSDLQYEPETHHPFDMMRKTDKVEPDMNLFAFYKNAIKFRKENPVLVYGNLEYTLVDDAAICLAYSRFDEKTEIVVVFNKSNKVQNLSIPVKKMGKFENIFDAKETFSAQANLLKIEMPPMKAKIFKLTIN